MQSCSRDATQRAHGVDGGLQTPSADHSAHTYLARLCQSACKNSPCDAPSGVTCRWLLLFLLISSNQKKKDAAAAQVYLPLANARFSKSHKMETDFVSKQVFFFKLACVSSARSLRMHEYICNS